MTAAKIGLVLLLAQSAAVPEATIRGLVLSPDGQATPIDLDPLGRDEAHVGPDGSFTIDGLFGTRAFRLLGLPAGWQVTAIRQGRSDVTSSGVDLAPGSATEIAIVVAKR